MKVGIVGTSGYSGGELLRLLSFHPDATVEYVASTSRVGERVDAHFPSLKGFYDLVFEPVDAEAMAARCDVVFTATPHGVAMDLAAELFSHGTILIDIGADFRFRDAATFEKWYKTTHTQAELSRRAVYGLTELFRDEIAQSDLIANPGCYPTSTILALAPLVTAGAIDLTTIHVFSMSGVSGAGATPKPMYHFPHCVENVQPYGLPAHRHTPEIEQGIGLLLGRTSPAEAPAQTEFESQGQVEAETQGQKVAPVPPVTFVPHLVPMSRGILTHVSAQAEKAMSSEELLDLYQRFYQDEPFVRVLTDRLPDTKSVAGSNFCDVTAVYEPRTGRVMAVSALDNLVKGASGQAIQNMNVRFGLPETSGLWAPGLIP